MAAGLFLPVAEDQHSSTALEGSSVEALGRPTVALGPFLVPQGVVEGPSEDRPVVYHTAAARGSSDRRAESQQGLLWDHDPRTFGDVLGSEVVGRWSNRNPLSAAPEGMHAGTGCKAGQERSKKALDCTEAVLLTRVEAEGRRASTISTYCYPSCPSSGASPAQGARVAEMQSAALQKLEARVAVVGCKARPFDGCLVPGPVVVAAGAESSVAACPESWPGRT